MNDFFIFVLVAIVAILAGSLITMSSTKGEVMRDCESMKMFRINDKVFTCEARNG